MGITIEHLFHYPIKGLRAQALDSVALQQGHGFPMDRAYGFARPDSGFDPANPKPLPKTKFVVLARDPALAQLETTLDSARGILTITRGDSVRDFDVATEFGRAGAAKMVAEHLGYADDLRPTLYRAEPHKFTDVSVVSPAMMNAVSLINLDSVAAFSEAIGHHVDPARFRGNLVVSGLPAFSELDMMDQELTIGDVRLRGVLRTKRCPATEVNVDTGVRDLDIPQLLREQYGHSDMGIYVEVIAGGTITTGDAVSVVR